MNSVHSGSLPLSRSFVKLNEDNLVLTSVKKAEDSNAWIIQWYDAGGRETEATLTLPSVPKRVLQSNFMEVDGKPIKFNGKVVKVKTKKNSVETIKVYF